jgi:hypothetical protein
MAGCRIQSGTVSLAEPKERIHFRSKVEAMDKSAEGQRDFDAFVVSAKGEGTAKHAKALVLDSLSRGWRISR